MAANNLTVARKLNGLYRLCKAGERGFLVTSKNASNRGLKVVLKTYAEQRATFAQELKVEIRRLGGQVSERRSIRGVIHRGRITIRAAMTIGNHNVENVVLGEALKGENVIQNAYKRTLDMELPEETQEIISRQYEEISLVGDQIKMLRGHNGRRSIVRLFDKQQDTEMAIQTMEEAGFDCSSIQVIDVDEDITTFEGEGSTVNETLLSGAFGGALWGGVIGALAGIGPLLFPEEMAITSGGPWSNWLVIALAGVVIGALFGAIFGFLIGHSTAEEDTYLYDDSVEYGSQLIWLQLDEEECEEASRILHKVNAAARARRARPAV